MTDEPKLMKLGPPWTTKTRLVFPRFLCCMGSFDMLQTHGCSATNTWVSCSNHSGYLLRMLVHCYKYFREKKQKLSPNATYMCWFVFENLLQMMGIQWPVEIFLRTHIFLVELVFLKCYFAFYMFLPNGEKCYNDYAIVHIFLCGWGMQQWLDGKNIMF
jgi:hypothetical protein